MKVFISWSGGRSLALAEAMMEWLPRVLQGVEPWLSRHSIDNGARWSLEIAKALEETSLGITCLTRDNLKAPWILFEAGALTKFIQDSRLCTYLLDVTPKDIEPPLGQFQHTRADKEETRRLIGVLNKAQEKPLGEAALKETFDLWWPKLEERIKAIPPTPDTAPPARSTDAILEDLLGAVRSVERQNADISKWVQLQQSKEAFIAGAADERARQAAREALVERYGNVTLKGMGAREFHEILVPESVPPRWVRPKGKPADNPRKDDQASTHTPTKKKR
jgi:hypothetical protein